jgi:hypothetical protein
VTLIRTANAGNPVDISLVAGMNMAQPNVVREPSMEEILASIRRIIESNEPGAGNSISSSLPPVYTVSDEDREDAIHLTVDEELAAADFNDASPVAAEPRFVAANSQSPLREIEAPTRNLSLADVAARVRAASERNAAQLQASRELPPAMAARFAETQRAPAGDMPLRGAIAEVPAPVIAPAAATMLAEAVPAAPAQQVVPEPAQEAPAVASREVPPSDASHFPQAPAAERAEQLSLPSPLLSQTAGAQVARSFGELAAAIDGSQRRSLDEIAEDMLRPMLQEWLDDNLPTLVERLVREEIERVARGPRR